MAYDLSLGVWQTEHCVRCGGCCYVCIIELGPGCWTPPHRACRYLKAEPERNRTTCTVYPVRPAACRGFFCDTFTVPQRQQIAWVVLNIFGIKPVEDAEGVMAALKRLG